MNFDLASWLARTKSFYNGLERRQRLNLILAGGVFLLIVVVLSIVLMNPNYQLVFSNLDAKSAGAITQKLDQSKIPYELQGNSILVPAAQADKVRIDMAMAGLTNSGYIDYSSIMQQGNLFGMSSTELNLQVLNVLQNRIAQSLESINGVSSAQVNIVMPQQQTFIDQTGSQNAKASVVLTLGAGVTLSPGQVFGIQQLVAHAVPSLAASDVSIVDQNGNDLSSQSSSTGSFATGATSVAVQELSLKQQVEDSLASNLNSNLARMIGAGNVSVIVHANVTFTSETIHQHVVAAGPPLSSQASSSSTTGAGTTGGGIAGQATQNPNLTTYGAQGNGAGGSSLTRSSTTNYDNNYTNIAKTLDPLQINGYTVSVMINSSAVPLTPKLTQAVRSYVQTAIGLTTTPASSSISVIGVPFAASSLTTNGSTGLNSWLTIAGALGLLLGVGGVVFGIMRSRNRRRLTTDALESLTTAAMTSPPQESAEVALSNQLRDLALRRPEAFASLLRAWISED